MEKQTKMILKHWWNVFLTTIFNSKLFSIKYDAYSNGLFKMKIRGYIDNEREQIKKFFLAFDKKWQDTGDEFNTEENEKVRKEVQNIYG